MASVFYSTFLNVFFLIFVTFFTLKIFFFWNVFLHLWLGGIAFVEQAITPIPTHLSIAWSVCLA